MNTPRLRIIAGPNGSGKTTLTRYLAQEHLLSFGFYINADDIERKIKTELQTSFAQFKIVATDKEVKDFFIQHPLNKNNLQKSFIKIQLLQTAHAQGYRNYLYYICTDDVLINKERIAGRILMGEHAVPEEKIASRYIRSLSLLLDAIKASDRAYLFDNSGQSHELIAKVTEGNIIDIKKKLMPGWFIEAVISKL